MTTNNLIPCPMCGDKKKITKLAGYPNPDDPWDLGCDAQGYEIDCPNCCAKLDEQIKYPPMDAIEKIFNEYQSNGSLKDAFVDGYEMGFKEAVSRIDNEKAAAVQEERERVLDAIEETMPLSLRDYVIAIKEKLQEPQNDPN